MSQQRKPRKVRGTAVIDMDKLFKGQAPFGWISVYDHQPPETGVYNTIRQFPNKAATEFILDDTSRNRFIRKNGIEVWQTGDPMMTVLAWK